jgi:hypothetical protein
MTMTLRSPGFLHRQPISPRDARQLAAISARLCRLLRDAVAEQIAIDRLIELEPRQADLLERVCSGPTISGEALRAGGALAGPQGANQ